MIDRIPGTWNPPTHKGPAQGLLLSFILPLLLTSGCAENTPEPGPDAENTTTLADGSASVDFLDAGNILTAVYLNRRTPDGFYSEPQPDPGVFEAVRHIKNHDVLDPGDIMPDTPDFELCASTFTEALDWSETAAGTSGDLVDNRDDPLYYEFIRVNLATPHILTRQRVYKCSMLDRSSIDINNPDNRLGLYTEIPPTGAGFKRAMEYLWTFSFRNNYGNAVLNSTSDDTIGHFHQTFHQAIMTPATVPGGCDTITIFETNHLVEKASGEVTVFETVINTLQARFQEGLIETTCS